MAKTMTKQATAMLAMVAAIGLGAFAPSAAQAQSKVVSTPVMAKVPAVGPSSYSSLPPVSSGSPVGTGTPVGGYTTSVASYTPKGTPVIPEPTPSVPVVTRMDMPKPGFERTSGGEFRNLDRLEQIRSVGQVATPAERRIETPRRPLINMLENRLIVSTGANAKPADASRNAAIQALDAAKPLI